MFQLQIFNGSYTSSSENIMLYFYKSFLIETLIIILHCTTAQCLLVILLSDNVSTDGDSEA